MEPNLYPVEIFANQILDNLLFCRYKLLAQAMVDEMLIMRANPLRFKMVHLLQTLEEFEEDTMWIHVLSAR